MGAAVDLHYVERKAAERGIDLDHPSFTGLRPKALLRVIESEPTLLRFCPDAIPYQRQALRLIRKEWDYNQGNLEILLSGSYGSAKSVFLAHLAVTHCLENKRARVAIVRRALPDLKETLFKEILEHIEGDSIDGRSEGLVEGVDYFVNRSRGKIRFSNGSEIMAVFWADKKYKRARSLKLSMVLIEEAAENTTEDKEGFDELKSRLRRLPHVKENVLVCATNPDSQRHWLYEYFIEGAKKHANRRVFFSRTYDNPYLSPLYVAGLLKDLDPKKARRYVEGEWIDLNSETVYYAYSSSENFRQTDYEWDLRSPIYLAWDFNIGVGKPLSMCCFQYINDEFHFGKEVVVEGMRTADSVEELIEKGVLDLQVPKFIVCGDASGKHKDTRNRKNDYEIIMDLLVNYETKDGRRLNVERQVPLANPTIRSRHNRVNAYCLNKAGQRRLFVYAGCPMLHKGFRLVELKKNADYIEDDSKDYQHVTTAAGYGIKAVELWSNVGKQGSREI